MIQVDQMKLTKSLITKEDDGQNGNASIGEQGAVVEQVAESRCDGGEVENCVDEPENWRMLSVFGVFRRWTIFHF